MSELSGASRIKGKGEMADLVRSRLWEETTFGPLSEWPEGFVAAVNMMLLSPFPFALYWGPEHRLLYNDTYRPFLNLKHPWALGSKGEDVWAEAWSLFGDAVESGLSRGTQTTGRSQYIPILSHGRMEDRWWSWSLFPVYGDDSIVAVANSVTEETAGFLANQALRKSQEEFQLGMEAGALGMWHYDPNTGTVVADDRMHRIFGSPEQSGTVDYWIDLLHPEDRTRVLDHFTGALAGEHPYDLEYRILRDGEVRWLRSKGKVIGTAGTPERMFAVLEDITSRKLAEAGLQQSEKLAAVGRLASTISHEINNPLEAVTNLLYIVQGSGTLSQQDREHLELADRELARVSRITAQTLRFHRSPTTATSLNVRALLGEVLDLYGSRLTSSHIEVRIDVREHSSFQAFEGDIRQVLNNLVSNAFDVMRKGGVLLLRARPSTNWKTLQPGVSITIADNGPGMAVDTRAHLFEAFYSTKGIHGSGLGLWVSKRIMHKHKGHLCFRSSTGEVHGTVFRLWLPCEAASTAGEGWAWDK